MCQRPAAIRPLVFISGRTLINGVSYGKITLSCKFPKPRYSGMGRPQKYTDEQIINALNEKRGMIYHAADLLGCDADTIYDRSKSVPEVAACLRMNRGKVIDTAEMKLFQALDKNESWAISLTLKTIGKDRGYYEKQEIDSSNKTQLIVTEEIVDAESQDDQTPPGPALVSAQ